MAKIQVAFCLLVALTAMLQVEAGYRYPERELYGKSSHSNRTYKAHRLCLMSLCHVFISDTILEQKKRKIKFLMKYSLVIQIQLKCKVKKSHFQEPLPAAFK